MTSLLKKTATAMLCIAILIAMLSTSLSCLATVSNSKDNIVRVGWFPLEGSQEYDEHGNPCGYSYDCLQALSRHTGLTFEYVGGSFAECLAMLKHGDLDLMLFVQYTAERGQSLSFCDVPLCKLSSFLSCKKSQVIHYDGKESLAGKTIAVAEGSYQEKELADWMAGSNIDYTVLSCRLTSDALQTVDDGIADFALVPSMVRVAEEQAVVASINTRFANIAVSKSKPELLRRVNNGLSSILDVDPIFFQNRYESHFGSSNQKVFILSKQEKNAVKDTGSLRVYLNKNAGYLSRYEDGEWCGIRADVVKLISQKLGIPYEFIYRKGSNPFTDWKEGPTAFISGFYFDYAWANACQVSITTPYLTHKYYCVKNKDYTGTQEDARVAVLREGNHFTDTVIVPDFSKDQLIRLGSTADCLKAVNDGRADMTFVSAYIAEYYLQGYDYPSLTTGITEYTSQVCFAAPKGTDPLLISAVNKAIESITDTEMEAIILKNSIPNPNNFGIRATIYRNPLAFFGIVVSLLVSILVAVIVFVYSHKLQAKNRELQKANESKTAFFSRMSHDMRTPMNAILSFSQLAREESHDEHMNRYLEDIHSSGDYLLSLINDVLDIQKMEYQGIVLHPEVINIDEVFSSIFEMVKPMMQEKALSFKTSLDVGGFQAPHFCQLDPLRFRQIFVNLLSNAVKFTPPGGTISFDVVILSYENGVAQTAFTVSDTGIGMSEDFQKQMFEPFTQEDTNKTSTYSGTGLGLSIVKNLVDGTGGSIHCESELGKGTKMLVTLPLFLMEEEEYCQKPVECDDSILKGKRILLCEDHPMNVKIAEKLLSKKEMLIDTAENGQVGLDRFLAAPTGYYDSILMDIRMPVMDGLDTAKAIRASKHPDAKTIPILAMTANAFADDIEESTAAGMNAHLPKPINPENLYRALCQYMMQRKTALQEGAMPHD